MNYKNCDTGIDVKSIIVTGASSGLGKLIKKHLEQDGHNVVDWSLETGVDITRESSVEMAARELDFDHFSCVINCAGINEIGFIENTLVDDWDSVMDTNARGIFLVTKVLLKHRQLRSGTILNIVSNASHMPMTASIAYNASKGAAAIMTLQMARELMPRNGITVFGISPNKLAGTGMSEYIERRVLEVRGFTAEQAKAYQLAALPAREETDPEALAEFIAFIMSTKQRHKYLAGCIIPYGA